MRRISTHLEPILEPKLGQQSYLSQNVRVVVPLGLVQVLLYEALNWRPWFPSRELPLTWLDRTIPWWTWTVWGYFALIALAIVLPLGIRDRGVFRRLMVAYAVSMGTAMLFFTFWPTHYPRPPLPTDDSWSSMAYRHLLQIDTPECCFPSSHIIVPLIACVALWQDGRRQGWWRWLPVGVCVCTATILTTKQHYAWDLVGGAVVAAWGIGVGFAVGRRKGP